MPVQFFGISLGMPVPILIAYGQDRDFVKERVSQGAARRGNLVPDVLRTFGRIGPCGAAHQGRNRRQRLEDERPEGLDLWAQYCDYGVIVARSDPSVAKHKGLTYFWVDMKAKGVEVRPIKLAGGRQPRQRGVLR